MLKYIPILIFLILLLGYTRFMNAAQTLHYDFIENYIINNNKIISYQNPIDEKASKNIIQSKKENKEKSHNTKETMIKKSWEFYKKNFISNDGRVIDHQRNSVSTSEGQAYGMRRALLMRDKETFDKIYNWAKYNLQHKNDHLFAWLWGQKMEGHQGKMEYGVIDQNGASDAGIEIAACLIFASKEWNDPKYIEDARKIINDIWDKETITIKGERILVAGIYQKNLENIEINPSYFMPYTFKLFARIDNQHDWLKVSNSSYRITNWCLNNIKSGLPPDVFYMNKKTGAIIFDKEKSDFSYDAIRLFYRFYIDYKLTKDKRALPLLLKSKMFINKWKKEKKIYTSYEQNGDIKDYTEAIGSIALMLPVIEMYDKNVAKEIYQNRIKEQYNPEGYWNNPMDYYAQNLVWFGNWLYQNDKNIKKIKY